MVELIGGTIDCKSKQGEGTTFTVVLDIPVADRQRDDMQLDSVDILIVDDDEIMLKTAVDTIESLGATAEQASGGIEAVGMVRHRHQAGRDYDVIIVDWKMPDVDGIETISRIRSEVPMSDDGAFFLDMPNLQFSVNKDSFNLDMANEFMRFLISTSELNEMAQIKGLMSPTKDLSFNTMYAAFGEVPESRILSPEEIGITDDAVIQMRQAVYRVSTGEMTIDEAVKAYGTFEQ
ncbi:MAG: response regulator [Lachnospiraceae bacterium]|nr:response regulator [Lachnospiraceae bacterium]